VKLFRGPEEGYKQMKRTVITGALAVMVASALCVGVFVNKVRAADGDDRDHFHFQHDTLVLSRSVYVGTAATVTVGQTLPPGCVAGNVSVPLIAGGSAKVAVTCATATADGAFPQVFNNAAPDGSFGVTSPIFLDNLTTDGDRIGTLPVPTDLLVTSYSSKSELAVNRSTDGRSITFVGYHGGPGFVTAPNQLDVSNSNTPGLIDPTNPVVSQYYRAVVEVDSDGHMSITDGNAYSGDNGRAAMKGGNGLYYLAGNDNNGGLSKTQLTTTQVGVNLVNDTGSELLVPGQVPPVPPNVTKIGNFLIAQEGYTTPDKPGKDDNFRGLTIFDNTLYVSKGSGGNGINTVYQVGSAGVLPTGTVAQLVAEPITILPGFPTGLASGVNQKGVATPVSFPFGLFFADANTLYVCDEGDGTLVSPPVNGNVADASSQATAGLQKWSFSNGSWQLLYIMNDGLDIGIPYSVPGLPATLNPATDGCRNITGRVNRDGTVDIWAITSTVSNLGDQGGDSNKLVKVTDLLRATTLPKDHGLGKFKTLRTAKFAEVFRGIAFAPDDHHHF
jgi:hypothetical protein